MDKAPFVPVIDARVFSDLQKLRGRKDLVVKRTSGHYEGGWELPLHAQVFQALSDDQLHVIVTKKQSIFSSSADEKEVDVRELIQLNIPQDVSTPTTPKSPVYGIYKPRPNNRIPFTRMASIDSGRLSNPNEYDLSKMHTKMLSPLSGRMSKLRPYLMSMPDIKAELQYVAQQHPVHARSRSV